MPFDRKLAVEKAAQIIRILKLDEFCRSLPDEALMRLTEACNYKDEQAVLALASDPRLALALFESMKSDKGWAEILEAIDLEQYHRQFPDGGGEWMN